MSRIFSDVLQMSIVAAWMIPIVMVFRLLLKRAPKWVNLVLWGLVGLRLVCPFCAGEPVQSDAEAADIVGLFVRKYDRQFGRKCVPG